MKYLRTVLIAAAFAVAAIPLNSAAQTLTLRLAPAPATMPALQGGKFRIVEPEGYAGVNHPKPCKLDDNAVPSKDCHGAYHGRDPATGR